MKTPYPKPYTLHPNSGFTLIEALMYITIAGAILTVIATFWGATLSTRAKNNAILEVELQGTQISNEFSRATHSANTVFYPAAGATQNELRLKTTSSSTGVCGTADTVCFLLSSGVINIREGTAAAVALNNTKVTVSALSFQNLSGSSTPGTVQITYTVSYANQGGGTAYEYSKTFTTSATVYKL